MRPCVASLAYERWLSEQGWMGQTGNRQQQEEQSSGGGWAAGRGLPPARRMLQGLQAPGRRDRANFSIKSPNVALRASARVDRLLVSAVLARPGGVFLAPKAPCSICSCRGDAPVIAARVAQTTLSRSHRRRPAAGPQLRGPPSPRPQHHQPAPVLVTYQCRHPDRPASLSPSY